MARIVLGIGTSHSPMLSIPPDLWGQYALRDRKSTGLLYPPDGLALSFEEGLAYWADRSGPKAKGGEDFRAWHAQCQSALETLATTIDDVDPDVCVILSDDQDEWFYDSNMPVFAVYHAESAPVVPRTSRAGEDPVLGPLINAGYGDVRLDVPVHQGLAEHLIDSLIASDFDVARIGYLEQTYGGRVQRRFRGPDGPRFDTRTTPQREQGLPHGFSFVVKRLFGNRPRTIVPLLINTCYPPNVPSPARCFDFGATVGHAIAGWDGDLTVAVIASGGLSHLVVDEELDREILGALGDKGSARLRALPRERLLGATSECLNWVAAGGAVQESDLAMDLVAYVPTYRTDAGTGGGWAFGLWK